MNRTLEARFFAKVDGGDYTTCWNWVGGKCRSGYGRFAIVGHTLKQAHRVAWSFLRGDIPEGLELDHLCRNTSCVNPWHLEPVSPLENTQRAAAHHRGSRTECRVGHDLTAPGAYPWYAGDGCHRCLECRRRTIRESVRRHRASKKAQR